MSRKEDAAAAFKATMSMKTPILPLLLWFVLGLYGGHLFYFRKFKSAIGGLLLFIVGVSCLVIGVEELDRSGQEANFLVILGSILVVARLVWWLVDLLLLPRWAQEANAK